MSSDIPPVGKVPFPVSGERFEKTDIQQVLDHYYGNAPDQSCAGCNLSILQIGKSPLQEPQNKKAGMIEPDAAQHWGSVSKQFTAACVIKLVEKGKLSLSDDIRDPKFKLQLPELLFAGTAQKVTVDHLLQMRSGLPEMTTLSALGGQDDLSNSMEEKLELLRKYPFLESKPGSTKQYRNTNYYLLAEIVHALDEKGRSFPDFVREEIFAAHGMQSRSSADPSCPRSIQGYDPEFHPIPLQYSTWGASGVVGRPSDMAKWNAALDKGRYSALVESVRQPLASGETHYARGLNVGRLGDYTVIRHAGSIRGFATQFMRFEHPDPNRNFAFFLATNIDDIERSEEAAFEIANILAGEDLHMEIEREPPPPKPVVVSEHELKPYVGIYENKALGLGYQVLAREDKEKRTWVLQLQLNQAGKESKEIASFVPTRDKAEDPVVFRGPIGDWLEFNEKRELVLKGAKVAPFILNRS